MICVDTDKHPYDSLVDLAAFDHVAQHFFSTVCLTCKLKKSPTLNPDRLVEKAHFLLVGGPAFREVTTGIVSCVDGYAAGRMASVLRKI